MKIGYKQLLDEAMSEVETLSVEDAIALHEKGEAQFVDLRDIRELRHLSLIHISEPTRPY